MITLDEGGRGRSRQRFFAPPVSLGGLVEHMAVQWFPEGSGPRPWRIVPDGSPHLVVHEHAPDTGRGRRFAVVGPRSRYVDIDVDGRLWSVVLRLRPDSLSTLTRLGPGELLDRGEAASAVGLPGVWIDRVLRAPTERAAARALIAGLLTLPRREPDALVREAVRLLEAPTGLRGGGGTAWGGPGAARPHPTIREVAHRLGASERTLRSRFGDAVGLAPKRFARVSRLHATLRRAQAVPSSDGSRLAHSAGYHDQSHMIRDFQALLGATPRDFVARAMG